MYIKRHKVDKVLIIELVRVCVHDFSIAPVSHRLCDVTEDFVRLMALKITVSTWPDSASAITRKLPAEHLNPIATALRDRRREE